MEQVIAGNAGDASSGAEGVILRTLVSSKLGSGALSPGTATFVGGAQLPFHRHGFSEAITVVNGKALVLIQDRAYLLGPRDSIHVPANLPHLVRNEHPVEPLLAHWAFASGEPTREIVAYSAVLDGPALSATSKAYPEHLVRAESGSIYELSQNAFFCDLFARRFGSVGICGGYGRFLTGASLPCHTHDFNESITIVKGHATCLVQGRKYELSSCDTAFVPRGLPHRFLNLSNEEMAMVWVYASSEPDRNLVDQKLCSGDPVGLGSQTDRLRVFS